MPVRVLLLGTPRILVDGVESMLPATRPAALLAYLGCHGGWVTREELALLFRPDAGDAEARHYLRKLIYRARALPFALGLRVTDDRVRWSVDSDVGDLRGAVAERDWAFVAMRDGGVLLEGFDMRGSPGFEAWLEIEREDVALLWRRGVVAHAGALEAAGRLAAAAALRERYLDRDPLDETVVQDLLRTFAKLAERSRGLAAYEAFARHLGREIGAQPTEVTQTLADALRAMAPAAPTGRATGASELPRPTTAFVGREAEVEHLVSLLRPGGPRLLALVGLGGVGKTRLAIEAVTQVARDLPNGVAYVPLASAPRGQPLHAAVASALGAPDDEARVLALLAERISLLVLDDVEHLVGEGDDAGAIAAMLAAAPGLRVLVGSRAPLGLAAEHVVRVEGLDVPVGDEGLRGSEAVTLFLRCAARVTSEIVDDDATVRTVAEICRLLGGLPLAIELAATWTRTMSVEGLRDELRGGEDLLRTEAADVPARQRSVRAVIEHAWQGLDPHHRAALERLTVFCGPWSLAGARAVAGADLDTMVGLLTSSMVRRSAPDRFEMHELVRRGARRPVDDATRDAHARYVLSWLADRTPDLTAGDQPNALAEVHEVLADVRAAWHHAVDRCMIGAVSEALVALDHALHARSLWGVAREAYRAALDRLPMCPAPASTRLRLQVFLANVERNVGDTDTARALLQAALADAPDGGRPRLEARLELAKLDDAVHSYEAAEASFRSVLADAGPGDDDIRAMAHTGLGDTLFAGEGETAEAMRHYDDGLAAARRFGNLDLVTIALINLGAGHYDLGQLPAARRSWREAAELSRALGNRLREAATLNNLAALAERSGDFAGAREAYERSLAVRHEVGDRRGRGRVLLNLGRLAQVEGKIDEADAYVEASVATYEGLDTPADLALALATRARIRAVLGDLGGAARMTERSLRLGRISADRTSMLVGLLSAATIELHRGRPAAAHRAATVVATLAAGREEGVRLSAEALADEAERALPVYDAGIHQTGEPEPPVSGDIPSLLVEVDLALRDR